jgi:hypothetical protein
MLEHAQAGGQSVPESFDRYVALKRLHAEHEEKDYLNHGDQDEILVHCFVQRDSPYSPGRANYIEISRTGST